MQKKVIIENYKNCINCNGHKFIDYVIGKDYLLNNLESEFGFYKCIDCGLFCAYPELSHKELNKYYSDNYPIYNFEKNDDVYNKYKLNYKYRFISKLLKIFYSLNIVKYFYFYFLELILLKLINNLPYEKTTDVLDIGCGNCHFIKKWSRLNVNCTGIDIFNSDMELSNFNNIKLINANFESFTFNKRNIFDIVHISHTLEHFNKPDLALKKINEILKDEGYLIIRIPIFSRIENFIFKKYWLDWDFPRHRFLFSRRNIKQFLKKFNFHTIYMINEINSGNITQSIKNIQKFEQKYTWLNLENNFFKAIISVFSFLLWLLRDSGRIIIICKKK